VLGASSPCALAKPNQASPVLSPSPIAPGRSLNAGKESDFIFWRWVRDPLDGEGKAKRIEHTWAYREFQKGIKAAGLEDVELHDLRRTCGCRLIQDKGFSLLQVSKVAGPLQREGHREALCLPVRRSPREAARQERQVSSCINLNRAETGTIFVCPLLCPRVLRSLHVPLF